MNEMQTLNIEYLSKEWHELRANGIGGSECAAAIGLSPYKSNITLWEEKTGKRKRDDLSDLDFVQYGLKAEEYLAQLFLLDFPQYDYIDTKNIVYKKDCMIASLDGMLIDKKTGEKGILEIKTANDFNGNIKKLWANNEIPVQYFCQLLHYFAVNDELKFAYIKCQINHKGGELPYSETVHRYIERQEVTSYIAMVRAEEAKFWECVKTNKRPNGKLL